MTTLSSVGHIKHSKKESLFLKEIMVIFRELSLDDPRMTDLFVSRVGLSADCGMCTVFFYTPRGEEYFKLRSEMLKGYAPGIRKVLSQRIKVRHTPEIFFKFDDRFEKEQRIENILEKIKTENEPSERS